MVIILFCLTRKAGFRFEGSRARWTGLVWGFVLPCLQHGSPAFERRHEMTLVRLVALVAELMAIPAAECGCDATTQRIVDSLKMVSLGFVAA